MENPEIIMQKAIKEINYKIKQLCEYFEDDFSQVETWLIANRSEQYQKAERLLQATDTDIYRKYLDERLLEFELKAWSNVLAQWRDSWIEMLKQYWQANEKEKVA